jgi:hypothetical protein
MFLCKVHMQDGLLLDIVLTAALQLQHTSTAVWYVGWQMQATCKWHPDVCHLLRECSRATISAWQCPASCKIMLYASITFSYGLLRASCCFSRSYIRIVLLVAVLIGAASTRAVNSRNICCTSA